MRQRMNRLGWGSGNGALVLALLTLSGCQDVAAPAVNPRPVTTPAFDPTSDYLFAPTPSLPTPRSAMAIVVFGGPCAWSIGGADAPAPVSNTRTNEVDTICISTPAPTAWTPGPPLPQALSDFAGAGVIGGKIYLAGGLDVQGNPSSVLYVYTKTNGWRADAEAMPFRMACGGAAVVNAKLYVYGATPNQIYPSATDCSPGQYMNVLAVYDPALTTRPRWRVLPSPPGCCRLGASVAAIGSMIYVVGDSPYSGQPATVVDVFDAGSGQWLPPIDTPWPLRWRGAAVAANGRLYYLGGYNPDYMFDPSDWVSVYDPSIGTWDDARPLLNQRRAAFAAASSNRIVVLGDPSGAEWHRVGSGPTACDSHEPDDVPAQATPWTVFGRNDPTHNWVPGLLMTHGRICSASDADLYEIPGVHQGSTVTGTLSMTPPTGKDYQLELLDATGTTVLIKSDQVGAGVPETLTYGFAWGVSYLVRVSSQDGSFDRVAPYLLETK